MNKPIQDEAAGVFSAWSAAIRPPSKTLITDWIQQHVELPHSDRSPKLDLGQSNWLIEPLLEFADNRNKELILRAPVGGSKTTMIEGIIPWIIAEEAGPTLLTGQTDADTKNWGESRLLPTLRACRPIDNLWPSKADRHKVRTMEIFWPHMVLYLGGANMSHLQEKSIRWVLCDEVWKWKTGLLEEARRRTHDRWNARVLAIGQGGVDKDTPWTEEAGGPDFAAAWSLTDQRVWHLTCPECGHTSPWSWSNIIYDNGGDNDQERDWKIIEQSAQYICRNCSTKFEDRAAIRRGLAESSKYIPTNTTGLAGHVGFHYNILTVWWVPWGKLAVEWVRANMAKHKANLIPLRQFVQKRLAEDWKDELGATHPEILGGGYVKADYADGSLIDDEYKRFLTVDVQDVPTRHFWARIRAWRKDGSSRGIYEGRIETWEMLRELQVQYGVKDKLTFVDGQFALEEVKNHCAKYGWTILHGHKNSFFTLYLRRTGSRKIEKVTAPYNKIRYHKTGSGTLVPYVSWCNDPVKDVLFLLVQGRGVAWETEDDASKQFHRHMRGEVKKDVVSRETKQIVRRWVRVHDNHLWDTEAMQVVVAMFLQILGDYTTAAADGSPLTGGGEGDG